MVEFPYTTEQRIISLVGQTGIDLRLDDSPDAASDLSDAIDVGTTDADVYLAQYLQSALAQDEFIAQCATFFAVRFLCLHRLNDLSESLEKECNRREGLLNEVSKGKRRLRVPHTRRPVAVTNSVVVLREFNNQVRVDRSRSTGVAQGYIRPDACAPDER